MRMQLAGRRHHDRRRGPRRRSVKHRLDIVAIGIQHEGCIVAGMVGALARRAVVAAARAHASAVKRPDDVAVRRLKRKMDLRYGPVGLVHEELVGEKKPIALDKSIRHAERSKHRTIETLARLEIGHLADARDQSIAHGATSSNASYFR